MDPILFLISMCGLHETIVMMTKRLKLSWQGDQALTITSAKGCLMITIKKKEMRSHNELSPFVTPNPAVPNLLYSVDEPNQSNLFYLLEMKLTVEKRCTNHTS